MNEEDRGQPDLKPWCYDGPPTLFDLVQNNILTNLIRMAVHLVLRAYLALFHRLTVINAGVVKDLASTLIAANHSSHLDVVVVQAAFPLGRLHKIRSLAAKDYFFANPLIRVLTFFIANTIPVSRKVYNPESFGFSQACLQEGANIIIFPEGTRTLTGEIQEFRPGIGMMSVAARVGILPVYIDGTYACFRKGRLFPKPGKITVVLGQPLIFEPMDNKKESWQWIAREVEAAVRALKNKCEKGE
ncbi:1-acyl-sn-glycerol-3-phosphate acyltransferase [candidate division FCPU426 bacterium]|nr:1-acyl-sn-glycerol-3-phosphate acyltransferase [candidate division FCPU426 bacterium]